MAELTIQLSDEKHSRLKQLAESRGVSVNKLIEELSTIALTELDTYSRFKRMAARGNVEAGLKLLDHLGSSFST